MIRNALDRGCIGTRENNATPFAQVFVCLPSNEKLSAGVDAEDTVEFLFRYCQHQSSCHLKIIIFFFQKDESKGGQEKGIIPPQ